MFASNLRRATRPDEHAQGLVGSKRAQGRSQQGDEDGESIFHAFVNGLMNRRESGLKHSGNQERRRLSRFIARGGSALLPRSGSKPPVACRSMTSKGVASALLAALFALVTHPSVVQSAPFSTNANRLTYLDES